MGAPTGRSALFHAVTLVQSWGKAGVQDPPGTAAQGFAEALSWEQASQGGSQTSQPCQTAQGLRRQAQSTGQPHFKPLGSSVTSDWKPGHLKPEKQIPCPLWLSSNYSLLLLVLPLSLNSPAHSFLTGESQCMSPKFSGRLGVQQPRVYTVL